MQIEKHDRDYAEEWFGTAEYTEQDIQELLLMEEHFSDALTFDVIIASEYKVTVVPSSGLKRPPDKILCPPKVYEYTPDERLHTHKLLGKDSQGLPPPNICQ
jgi:hypothetical protein